MQVRCHRNDVIKLLFTAGFSEPEKDFKADRRPLLDPCRHCGKLPQMQGFILILRAAPIWLNRQPKWHRDKESRSESTTEVPISRLDEATKRGDEDTKA